MNRYSKAVGTITLAFFLCGCSSYKMVAPPQVEEGGEELPVSVATVAKGDQVKVTLSDNQVISGKVASVASPMLTVAPQDSDFKNPIQIEEADIQTIEKRSFSTGKTLILVGSIVLPFVVFGVAVAASGGMSVNAVQ